MTETVLSALAPSTLHAAPLGAAQADADRVSDISVTVSTALDDVEAVWRELTDQGVESPGQSVDFIRAWIAHRAIAADDQRYVVGRVDGVAVALLPLHRRRLYGLKVLTWFPGANAGCYAPVAAYDRLAALGASGRQALWDAMTAALDGIDAVYLRSVPTIVGGHVGLFDQLGSSLAVETLYRSEYASWAECDRLQRSKSRRKHDRQQGDRLNAMGSVSFEQIDAHGDTRAVIDAMFRQRSARFKAMGIRDTFVEDRLIDFYRRLAAPGSGVDVRLHVLRLDGRIVAVRYNVVHADRMFCLISSMSYDPSIQAGSPGKQCLLRVMQSVFDQGIAVFDMGSGFTDEKRHWCNVQLPVRQHYIGLSRKGAMVVAAHRAFQKNRARIKANRKLKSVFRGGRQLFDRLRGVAIRPAAAGEPSD